ncbi:MAG: 3-methyl-2-oxobutanoate hydroxymethyltransferase [Gammaproteobacteria bacterium]|nr:3-methyl-2-oxobutanoate hydroxymethyltransferase [Gammaproteobacteria bacterium]
MYTEKTEERPRRPMTLSRLRDMKQAGEKITMLTAYDASFATLLDEAGVDVLLIGDSLGMVIQGHDTTLPVSVEDIVYHTRAVANGTRYALLIADMPFMSYATPAQALASAARLMQGGGAHMVKIEGGAVQVETVRYLAERGVPVCAHLGLTPQHVHKLGGYKVQGREEHAARALREDAAALEEAGADMLVLECVPSPLAAEVTRNLAIPVIGIGAGVDCDGQVLVVYDMLGITPGKRPKFSRDFLAGEGDVRAAVQAYVDQVRAGTFPGPEHGFS